jgi:hypothetical protein
MESMEDAFRDALRDSVSSQPAIPLVELDDVVARAARPAGGMRPVRRWIGLAAAVALAAGLGFWAIDSSDWRPTDSRIAATPASSTQVRTLRVHNGTNEAYRQAALQLADGRVLPLGDVPAGGTVLLPMDAATPTPLSSGPVVIGSAEPGMKVLYTGDCSGADRQVVAVTTDTETGDVVTVQIVVAPGTSTAPVYSAAVNVTVVPQGNLTTAPSVPESTSPAPGAGPTSAPPTTAPDCSITIVQAQPTAEPTHT